MTGCSEMHSREPISLNPDKSGVDRFFTRVILFLIGLYKRLISPLLGNQCRFHPSCSQYAREAFAYKPFWTACRLTLRRLVKCQPFHPGGYDPLERDRHEETGARLPGTNGE